jgi:predicted phosphodiesterase
MKLAILSDVHGNCLALDTVLADLRCEGISQLVCLGDMIQSGPQPAETVARLRALACPVVMGNSDAWLLSGVETDAEQITEERRQKLNVVREWSLAQLSEADKAFIAAFQPTIEISLGQGRNLLCFHGSPTSFDQFLLPSTPEDEFQEMLKPYADNILSGGHMHLQFTRRLRDSQNFFFNPGSVGVAYNHEQSGAGLFDPWAEYAILNVEGMQVSLEFRRVPLDLDDMAEVYRRSSKPFAGEAMAQYVRY